MGSGPFSREPFRIGWGETLQGMLHDNPEKYYWINGVRGWNKRWESELLSPLINFCTLLLYLKWMVGNLSVSSIRSGREKNRAKFKLSRHSLSRPTDGQEPWTFADVWESSLRKSTGWRHKERQLTFFAISRPFSRPALPPPPILLSSFSLPFFRRWLSFILR